VVSLTTLIVENEYLIAMSLGAALSGRGTDVILRKTAQDAVARLDAGSAPAVVVVEINLGDGISFELSQLLVQRGVPFVFATGYDRDVIPSVFANVPYFQKPYDNEEVADCVFGMHSHLKVVPTGT